MDDYICPEPIKSYDVRIKKKMEWISVKDKEPPKNERFLAYTTNGIELMQWVHRVVNGENNGWYAFYCPCACCSGYCTDSFSEWMPLPEVPHE